jgi:hypothetical protein
VSPPAIRSQSRPIIGQPAGGVEELCRVIRNLWPVFWQSRQLRYERPGYRRSLRRAGGVDKSSRPKRGALDAVGYQNIPSLVPKMLAMPVPVFGSSGTA